MAVTVPLGFRFVPTDLDLVRDYLLKKIKNQPLPSDTVVIEYDVYNMVPWNLPVNNIGNCPRFYSRKVRKRSYYFARREKNDDQSLCDGTKVKYVVAKCGDGTSNRILGYWKRTRSIPQDKLIRDEKKKVVGIMKTFVFHYCTTNNDNYDNECSDIYDIYDNECSDINDNNDNECRYIKTGWVMREYTLNSEQFQPLVLCSVINKSEFNISIDYDDKNNYIKRVNYCPTAPIDPDEAERNKAFFESACLALLYRSEGYYQPAQGM